MLLLLHNVHFHSFPEKKQYACLPDIMNLVAREEMVSLPEFVHKCCVVYIPEVGYLVAVTLWRDGLTLEEIELEGLEFKVISFVIYTRRV
jgi:hypothetical protein